MAAPRCQQLRRDGSPCTAYALGDSGRCLFHSESARAKRIRKAGRRKGGITTTHKGKLPVLAPIELPDATAVRAELALVATLLREGKLDPRTCHAFAALMNTALASLELESEPKADVQFIIHSPDENPDDGPHGITRDEAEESSTGAADGGNGHPSE